MTNVVTAGNVGEGDGTTPAAPLLGLLAETERAIALLAPGDLYGLCRLLHEATTQAGPVDAFYVCQYDAQTGSLHFPFNFDEGRYDHPSTFPLGNGPTSQVVRTGAPYVFPEPAATGRGIQDAGVPFGNLETRSEAAIHLPIWDTQRTPPAVCGVLSAQSYRAARFDPPFVAFLTCLAERTGCLWAQWDARRVLEEQLRQSRQSARELADAQVEGLKRIAREAEDVQRLVPPASVPLRDAVTHLRQTCYRLQTGLNILPLRPADSIIAASQTEPDQDQALHLLKRLSPREWEVAQLVAQGLSNKQISDHFTVSEHTIKTQVASILSKLKIEKRGQIAPLLTQTNVYHPNE